MIRLATGIALATVVALITLWSPVWVFAVLILAVVLVGWYEWVLLTWRSAGLKKIKRKQLKLDQLVVLARSATVISASIVAGITVIMIVSAVLFFRTPQNLPILGFAGLLFWLYHAVDMFIKREKLVSHSSLDIWHIVSNLFQGGCVLLFAWGAVIWMRVEQGALPVLIMFVIVWSADTYAYFVGRNFGERKLAAAISPNKTIEGLIGGLCGAGIISFCLAVALLDLGAVKTGGWVLVSLVAALFSVVGDLYESRLKRRAGVKDSGALLPGHGGILDRIDGLVAAAPIFVTLWWLG